MRFIQESGFRIRRGRNEAFQRWYAENEERIKRSYPEGTALLGVYAVVFGTEKDTGDMRVLEELDSYAALDRLAALGKDRTSEYAKVSDEWNEFLDPDPNAPWSQFLLKHVLDATVWDLPTENEADRTHPEVAGTSKP